MPGDASSGVTVSVAVVGVGVGVVHTRHHVTLLV
jgi:hypothetical protein